MYRTKQFDLIKPNITRFGRWLVIAYAGKRGNQHRWTCQCKCGTKHDTDGRFLISGESKSCGCQAIENATKSNTTHGMSYSPEHKAWAAMKDRCYNPKYRWYHRYGGRGIKVCKRWLHSFKNFYTDIGRRPGPEYSVNRKNNDGDYTPTNAVWSTAQDQLNNRKGNRLITWNGQTKTLSEWSRSTGKLPSTLGNRLINGWSVEDALTLPITKHRHPYQYKNKFTDQSTIRI